MTWGNMYVQDDGVQVHMRDRNTQSKEGETLRAILLKANFEREMSISRIGVNKTLRPNSRRFPFDYSLSAGVEMIRVVNRYVSW